MTDESDAYRAAVHQAVASAGSLPPPSEAERAHSNRLVQRIRDEIERSGGSIDFARYMELALYAPGLGYYRAGAQKLGAQGDFVTAPELSPLLARCLARQCQEVFDALGHAHIIEAGAGSGTVAVDLLRELETLDALPDHYFILELSAELKERQAARINQELGALSSRVSWLQALPDRSIRGVVVGNELLDAMPVHRFRVNDHGIQELHVAWDNDGFIWHRQPANEEVSRRVETLALAPSYTSEINLHAEAWVKSIADRLDAGVVLLIDYGFPRREFYHPQRCDGTLMCHYRHRSHANPFILVGLQDITAHVDFSAIAEAAHAGGLSLLGYTSQAAFLLASGLQEIASASDPSAARQHMELTQQIKKLTSPSEMGELYKVIALGRGIETPLIGFSLQDRRGRL